nr:MAG TPA: hypothetical protein [Caudoviricetes sp.]
MLYSCSCHYTIEEKYENNINLKIQLPKGGFLYTKK